MAVDVTNCESFSSNSEKRCSFFTLCIISPRLSLGVLSATSMLAVEDAAVNLGGSVDVWPAGSSAASATAASSSEEVAISFSLDDMEKAIPSAS